jgi:hypothetical protein
MGNPLSIGSRFHLNGLLRPAGAKAHPVTPRSVVGIVCKATIHDPSAMPPRHRIKDTEVRPAISIAPDKGGTPLLSQTASHSPSSKELHEFPLL